MIADAVNTVQHFCFNKIKTLKCLMLGSESSLDYYCTGVTRVQVMLWTSLNEGCLIRIIIILYSSTVALTCFIGSRYNKVILLGMNGEHKCH